jgi:photosystem II stability/assembly factor-like uncharacterized protein
MRYQLVTACCGPLGQLFFLLLFGGAMLQCSPPAAVEESPPAAIPNDWFYRQRAYPTGQIDQEGYIQALRQQQKEAQAYALRGASSPWVFRGPTNVVGRIADLAIHPSQPNTIYVGGASGGIFRSYDRGNTFEPIFDDALSLSIGDIEIAPSNPSILYAGTGEANAGGGSLAYEGVGVYKSTNGGDSWQHCGLEYSGSIGRILVHPQDPNRVYVGAMGRLFGNNAERGVYRSSDGGQSWEQTLFLNDSTGAIDLAMHPSRPDTLYAAMWERVRRPEYYYYGGYSSGIYRSYDGGDTWEKLQNGLPQGEAGRIGLALSPADPQVIYAQYITPIGHIMGVYRSNDGGDTWYSTGTAGVTGPNFMWWFGRLFPHPIDPEIVYFPSVHLFRTTNGGQNWANVVSGLGVHVDQHDLYIDPANPSYLVLANDGGLYISEDNAQSWEHKKGLPLIQFYTCEVDYSDPRRRYGGTQDNGTLRTITGLTDNWSLILPGDGFQVRVDPEDNRYVYGESQYGIFRRSTNGGTSFQIALAGVPSNERRNWNTPFVLNPLNPQSLYYGTFRLYKSDNRALLWTPISDNLTGPDEPGNLAYGTITTISVSAADTNLIFVATDNGRVWKTPDGGQNWQLLSSSLPRRWATRVATCPEDPLTAYVTFSGYRFDDNQAHVYKTIDGGDNWLAIAQGLPEVPVNALLIDPDAPERLFLANDIGVFASFNGGNTWNDLSFGLPRVVASDLCLHLPSQELYVGTYGRSMHSLPLAQLPEPAPPLSGVVRRDDGLPVPGIQALLPGPGQPPGSHGRGWRLQHRWLAAPAEF